VEARGSSEMATHKAFVAEILMVNINYFYNSDDEKLVITLHDKWGPIIYRLVPRLIVIFMPKTVTSLQFNNRAN